MIKYYAFISYSHKDSVWAKWLQHEFEYYQIPVSLNARKDIPASFRPIFRDEDELAGGSLKQQITEALYNSEYLIVVCSPNSANSEYVNDEIKEFVRIGKLKGINNKKRIFPFIIDGVPNAKGPNNRECFPDAILALQEESHTAIIGGDVNATGKNQAFIKILAGTLKEKNIQFSELWDRYEAYKIKEEERKKEELRQLQISQSRYIAEKVQHLVNNGNSYIARKLALFTLPQKLNDSEERPWVSEAERNFRFSCKYNSFIISTKEYLPMQFHNFKYCTIGEKEIDINNGNILNRNITNVNSHDLTNIKKKYRIDQIVFTSKKIAYFTHFGKNEIIKYDLDKNAIMFSYKIPNIRKHLLTISENEKYLIYASIDKLRVWNIQNNEIILEEEKYNRCLTPKIDIKNHFIIWYIEKKIILFNLNTKKKNHSISTEDFIVNFEISTKMGLLILQEVNCSQLSLWSYLDKEKKGTIQLNGDIKTFRFTGQYISVVYKNEVNHFISIYDALNLECIYTRKEICPIPYHQLAESIYWIAYATNNKIKFEEFKGHFYNTTYKKEELKGNSIFDFVSIDNFVSILTDKGIIYYEDYKINSNPQVILYNNSTESPFLQIIRFNNNEQILLSQTKIVLIKNGYAFHRELCYNVDTPIAISNDAKLAVLWNSNVSIDIYAIKEQKFTSITIDECTELSKLELQIGEPASSLLCLIDEEQLLVVHSHGLSTWNLKETKKGFSCTLNRVITFEVKNYLKIAYCFYIAPILIENNLYFIDDHRYIRGISLEKYTYLNTKLDIGETSFILGFELSPSGNFFLCLGDSSMNPRFNHYQKPIYNSITIVDSKTCSIIDHQDFEKGFTVCHFNKEENAIIIINRDGEILLYDFHPLQFLINQQKEKFKECPLTDIEKEKFYL